MSKGLNYLEKLKNQFGDKYDELTSFDENGNIIETKRFTYDKYYFEPIEKELKEGEFNKKVLDIIKKKRVDVSMLLGGFSNTLEEYNICELIYKPLTQEEYDLLKEVLL